MGRYANANIFNLGLSNDEISKEKEQSFRIEKIDINNIIPNIKNKYSIQGIEELKFSILHNGLKQNLEVKDNGDGTYSLLSGERRYTALKELVEEGNDKFRLIPCLITDLERSSSFLDNNGNEILTTEDKEDLAIVTTNSENREFTDSDRAFQVSTLKRIYKKLSDSGVKLPGKMSQLIAEQLDISKATVERLMYVEQHGTDELKQKLENNEISIGAASEVAHLSPAQQKEVLSNDTVTSSTVKEHQQKIQKKKTQRKENNTLQDDETIPLSKSKGFQNSLNQFKDLFNQIVDYDFDSVELSKEDIKFLEIKLNLSIKNIEAILKFL